MSTKNSTNGKLKVVTGNSANDPKVVVFACNWGAPEATDPVGLRSLPHGSKVRAIRVMCSGRINPSFVISAFEKGADGVLVVGCPPENCHYGFGNKVAESNMNRVKDMLHLMGIEEKRFRFGRALPEGEERFEEVVNKFIAGLVEAN